MATSPSLPLGAWAPAVALAKRKTNNAMAAYLAFINILPRSAVKPFATVGEASYPPCLNALPARLIAMPTPSRKNTAPSPTLAHGGSVPGLSPARRDSWGLSGL